MATLMLLQPIARAEIAARASCSSGPAAPTRRRWREAGKDIFWVGLLLLRLFRSLGGGGRSRSCRMSEAASPAVGSPVHPVRRRAGALCARLVLACTSHGLRGHRPAPADRARPSAVAGPSRSGLRTSMSSRSPRGRTGAATSSSGSGSSRGRGRAKPAVAASSVSRPCGTSHGSSMTCANRPMAKRRSKVAVDRSSRSPGPRSVPC